MVQHRPALGLWRRWSRPGPLLRRLQDRQADEIKIGLRASAAACLLHPGHRGRPRQRGRHYGLVGARGASVQIRSGTGSNFSRLRGEGEKLSGGGRSSGLMSFLKIGDRAAGAIKSGGTTRRAAKMVIVDTDHPDIEQFIDWKVLEEQKVASLVTGSKINQKHLRSVMKACVNCEGSGDDCFDPDKNPALRREIKAARRSCVPDPMIKRVIQFAKQGYKDIDFPVYDTDWDSEAYLTVSGQNSNNSVRVTDEFLKAVEADGDWDLTWRTRPGKIAKTVKARDLWEKIGHAAWASADPGLQYHSTINDWHTCPASGPIRAS